MKFLLPLTVLLFFLSACEDERAISSIHPENWDHRTASQLPADSTLEMGTTYLSVYSQIYSQTEKKTHDLTATVSIRNTNREDTLYIDHAHYFNTKGELIRSYFNQPIFVLPMETVEIVIDEIDKEGGTGANFLFDWRRGKAANDPLFESVMISTSGQQGLSFAVQGKRVQ